MDYPIYVREFSSKKVIETTTGNKYRVSEYFPYPMKDALKKALSNKGYIRNTDYIIGPLYSSREFQLGVTGTVEVEETPNHAMSRELGEEIGIVPKNKESLYFLKKYNWKRFGKPDIAFDVYETYIKHCIPVLEHQNGAILSKKPDDKRKVGCYLYGDKKSVLDFLGNKNIYVYASPDDIIGLVAFRADFALKFIGN